MRRRCRGERSCGCGRSGASPDQLQDARNQLTQVEVIHVDNDTTTYETIKRSDPPEPIRKRLRLAEDAGAARTWHFAQTAAVKLAKLDDKLEELDDEIEERGYQIRATNALQTKVDELADLALRAGADPTAVAAIRYRTLA